MPNEQLPTGPIVEPKTPMATPEAAPPAETGSADLPDEILKIPAMQAITAGQPGAFSANTGDLRQAPRCEAAGPTQERAHGGRLRTLSLPGRVQGRAVQFAFY